MQASFEVGEADLSDDGVQVRIDLPGDKRQERFRIIFFLELFFKEIKCGHFAKDRCGFRKRDWRLRHERALCRAGEHAVYAVAELVSKGHHIVVRSEVVKENKRRGMVFGKYERIIVGATTSSFGDRGINTMGVGKIYYQPRERWTKAPVAARTVSIALSNGTTVVSANGIGAFRSLHFNLSKPSNFALSV